jgi:carbonic anhydrase
VPDPLLDRSSRLRGDFFEKQGALLRRLAVEGQEPQALFVGCSDSRIMPEHMFGARPGDFFMLRNVANIIPPYIQTEIGIASVLEYAIMFLKVPHLIVCGHTDCGGIHGLDTQLDLSREPALTRWLELARPAKRDVDFANQDLDPDARHRAIVERNVVNQLHNVQSYPFVRQALEADLLDMHGWVYYLERQEIGHYNPESERFETLGTTL